MIENDTAKVVWILGAGFSRSLGGPLFETLFGPWSLANVAAHFPPTEFSRLYGSAMSTAHWLYNYGRRFSLGRSASWTTERGGDGEGLWQDAEEYLQRLDAAASDPPSGDATRIRLIVQRYLGRVQAQPLDLVEINGAARRLLAAECSGFTKGLHLDSDPAIPYVDWARRLDGKDTIITFNYDTVVEKLGKLSNIGCPTPGDLPQPGLACAYKLHGSVDWLIQGSEKRPVVQRGVDPFAALNCEFPSQMVIGNPGPTKSKMAQMLRPLWDEAGKALLEASAIVFVGYRFPPTDTYAQRFVLDAIEANKSKYLAVHVALGPETGSPASVRLKQLLRLALSSREEATRAGPLGGVANYFSLVVWSFYAADLLSRVRALQITQPYRY